MAFPVHMNGRVYDPQLGRFMSVDPVFQFPTNTQSLNPYTYVLNSPLSATDPTGLEVDDSQTEGAELERHNDPVNGGDGEAGEGGGSGGKDGGMGQGKTVKNDDGSFTTTIGDCSSGCVETNLTVNVENSASGAMGVAGGSYVQIADRAPDQIGSPAETGKSGAPKMTVDQAIGEVKAAHPKAGIETTDSDRTVEDQAGVMLDQARSYSKFLENYDNAPYAKEMKKWVDDNPDASREEGVAKFATLITAARAAGSNVSNHLNPGAARDIRVPNGDAKVIQAIRNDFAARGVAIHDESDNTGSGAHWHLSMKKTP